MIGKHITESYVLGGDLSGSLPNIRVVSFNGGQTPLTSSIFPLSLANGGTGGTTKSWVDLITAQTIAGAKTFTSSAAFNNGLTANTATFGYAEIVNTTNDATFNVTTTGSNKAAYLAVNSTSTAFGSIQGKVGSTVKWWIGRQGDGSGLNFYTGSGGAVKGMTLDDNQNVQIVNKLTTGSVQIGSTSNPGDIFTATDSAGNGSWQAAGSLVAANNLSDLASASTARTNLGLGGLATLSSINLTSNVGATILPIANGGTGSATQNFVDTSSTQTAIGGDKTLTGQLTMLSATPVLSTIGTSALQYATIGYASYFNTSSFGNNAGIVMAVSVVDTLASATKFTIDRRNYLGVYQSNIMAIDINNLATSFNTSMSISGTTSVGGLKIGSTSVVGQLWKASDTIGNGVWFTPNYVDTSTNQAAIGGLKGFSASGAGGTTAVVTITNTDTSPGFGYAPVLNMFASGLTAGTSYAQMRLGKAAANYNAAEFNFNYATNGGTGNTFAFGLYGNASIFQLDGTGQIWLQGGTGVINIQDAKHIALGTTTGTKIGTATSQKLGVWNATPIVQPTTAIAAATFVANTGTAVNDASTFDGYTMKQIVKALRNIGLLA